MTIQEISSRGRDDPQNAKIKIVPYSSPTPKDEDHATTMRIRRGLEQPHMLRHGGETDNDESLLDLHNKSGFLIEDQLMTRTQPPNNL